MTFECTNCSGVQERTERVRPTGEVAWQERYECANCECTGVLSHFAHGPTHKSETLGKKL